MKLNFHTAHFFLLTKWWRNESFRPAKETETLKCFPWTLSSTVLLTYIDKHVVSCHLSVFLSCSYPSSLHPCHLICCTICAAAIIRTPRALPSHSFASSPPPDSGSALSPGKKIKSSPARLFDWLVLSPTMQLPRRQIDSDVFRHTSRSAKKTQCSFHLLPKACFKWMS